MLSGNNIHQLAHPLKHRNYKIFFVHFLCFAEKALYKHILKLFVLKLLFNFFSINKNTVFTVTVLEEQENHTKCIQFVRREKTELSKLRKTYIG